MLVCSFEFSKVVVPDDIGGWDSWMSCGKEILEDNLSDLLGKGSWRKGRTELFSAAGLGNENSDFLSYQECLSSAKFKVT